MQVPTTSPNDHRLPSTSLSGRVMGAFWTRSAAIARRSGRSVPAGVGHPRALARAPGRRGGVGVGWIKASPGRWSPALPSLRDSTGGRARGFPVTRPAGRLTAPRPRGGARGREPPPSLCVCERVGAGGGALRVSRECRARGSGGGGGISWHTRSLHRWLLSGLCVPGALGLAPKAPKKFLRIFFHQIYGK